MFQLKSYEKTVSVEKILEIIFFYFYTNQELKAESSSNKNIYKIFLKANSNIGLRFINPCFLRIKLLFLFISTQKGNLIFFLVSRIYLKNKNN